MLTTLLVTLATKQRHLYTVSVPIFHFSYRSFSRVLSASEKPERLCFEIGELRKSWTCCGMKHIVIPESVISPYSVPR